MSKGMNLDNNLWIITPSVLEAYTSTSLSRLTLHEFKMCIIDNKVNRHPSFYTTILPNSKIIVVVNNKLLNKVRL